MEVTIGKEEHKFIEGPFTTFGEQMLEQVQEKPKKNSIFFRIFRVGCLFLSVFSINLKG